MEQTASRFFDLQKKHKPRLENGVPKNGQEFITMNNKFGKKEISMILNWKNGFLHSEKDLPAVQMEDAHTEYWEDGYLSNVEIDANGNQMPAVIADYGHIEEFWVHGERIK